jgi:dipeptidyl-peptidase-4
MRKLLLILILLAPFSQAQNMVWLADGNSFSALEGGKIVKTTLPSMQKTTLIEADKLKPAGTTTSLRISDFSWSKDFKKVLLNVETSQLYHKTTGDAWVYDTVSGKLTQLGKGFAAKSLMFPKFSPDGLKVAYVVQQKKNNTTVYNIYTEDLGTGRIKALTNDTKDRTINGTFDWVYAEELFMDDGFRWSPDSKKIAYWNIDASKVRNYLMLNTTDSTYSFVVPVEYPKAGEDPSPAKIGVVDATTARTQWMNIAGDPRQNYLTKMEWVNANELILQQLTRKQNESKIIIANAQTGAARIISQEKDEAWIDVKPFWNGGDNIGWDWIEGGKAFLWASEKSGWRQLYRIGLDGKESLVTKGEYDVMKLYGIDEPNGYVYFSASPTNATQRYLYRTKLDGTGTAELVNPDKLEGTHSYTFSPNTHWARHSFSSHNYFPASEWISLPDHKPLDEAKAIAKNLREDAAATKQLSFFQVTTVDGIKMDGWMMKSKDFDPTKKYPLFLSVYGEPFGTTVTDTYGTGKSGQFGGNIADKGYLYVSLENRGTPVPKGRAWRKAVYRKIGIVNIRDQAMGVKELLKLPYVDSTRVASHGWSGGGSSTLNLMFQYPDIFQCGIAVAAVADQLQYDNTYQERYMGLPQENREDFVKGSPYTYAKNLKGKLLYMHGTGDDNVHYSNAERLVNELIKYNRQFRYMTYPMRSHGIWEGEGTSRFLSTLSTNFLLENCPPGGK